MILACRRLLTPALAFALLVLPAALPAQQLIVNGGFESGFSGWTRSDAIGSDGTYLLSAGGLSAVSGELLLPPHSGAAYAVSDAGGPGAHALYQSFVVTGPVSGGFLEIRSGLNGGEQLLVGGVDTPQEGMKVKLQ
jgi:hypothetical protein